MPNDSILRYHNQEWTLHQPPQQQNMNRSAHEEWSRNRYSPVVADDASPYKGHYHGVYFDRQTGAGSSIPTRTSTTAALSVIAHSVSGTFAPRRRRLYPMVLTIRITRTLRA
jgi:hypothetical protein